MLFQELAEDDFTLSGTVSVGSVKGLCSPSVSCPETDLAATHVDTLIIGVFELLDSLIVVGNHPVGSGTVLHATKNQL